MKKIIHNFFLAHVVSIVCFGIVYYLLMINMNEHFIISNTFSNKLYNNKILNSFTLASGIESTNGYNELTPKSLICKLIITFQYLMTIIITGYFII